MATTRRLAIIATTVCLSVALFASLKHQQKIVDFVSARVTAALSSVTLNNGSASPVTPGTDITSQVSSLSPDIGAYTWTANGASWMSLNMPFDNGGTQTDFSGNGISGALTNGATYLSAGCKVGGCVSFDGVNDYINLGTPSSLQITTMTVEAWVKSASNATTPAIVMSAGGGWGFYINTSNNLCFGKIGTNEACSSNSINTSWHHVAVSYNGSTLQYYLDGTPGSTVAYSNPGFANTAKAIGARPDNIGDQWNGQIDEVRVWPRVLTAAQILSDYNDGLGTGQSNNDGVGGPTLVKTSTSGELWHLSVTPISTSGTIGSVVSSPIRVAVNAAAALSGTVTGGDNGSPVSASITTSGGSSAGIKWLINGAPIMRLNMPFNTGTQTDISSNSNNGTLTNGAAFTTSGCLVGGCVNFDGADDYVLVQDSSSLDISDNITLSAWVRPDAYTDGGNGGGAMIITKISAYYMEMTTSGKVRVYLAGLNTPGYHLANTTLPLSTWSHIAATYGGGDLRIYVNGVEDALVSGLSGSITVNNSQLFIGGYSSGYRFDGKIDEVQIYNQTLNSAQIASLYLDGLNGQGGPTRLVQQQHTAGNLVQLNAFDFLSDGTIGSEVAIGYTTVASETPTTLALTTPSGTQNGNITITYTCTNSSSAPRDILIQYSTNGASGPFANATLVSASSGSTAVSYVLGASCSGSSQSFVWNSLQDGVAVGTSNVNVRLRITAQNDANPTAETTNFTVSNPVITGNTLNSGSTTAAPSSDITSDATVAPTVVGAYRWMRDGGNALMLNLPFNSGSNQQDLSGNGNVGTSTNSPVVLTSGCKVGHCMSFNGTNQRIDFPDNGTLNSNTGFTLETWIKTTSAAANNWIINKTTSCASSGYILALNENSVGAGRPAVYTAPGGWLDATATVHDGNWHHIVGTNDGATSKIYVDGVLDNSGARTGSGYSTGVLGVGGSNNGCVGFYSASTLDEVKIYPYAISASQVLQSYTNGNAAVGGPTIIKGGQTGDHWGLGIYAVASSTISSLSTASNEVWITDGLGSNISGSLNTVDEGASASATLTIPNGSQTAYQWTLNGRRFTTFNIPFNAGATQKDLSGNGFDATGTGSPTYTTTGCKTGGCMTFSGSNYLTATGDFNPGTGPFSMEMWVKTTAVGNSKALMNMWTGAGGEDVIMFDIGPSAFGSCSVVTGGVNFIVRDGGTEFCAESASAINDGNWHHVVGVRNGDVISIYVDGTLGSNQTGLSGRDISPPATALNIGGGNGFWMTAATIDEVRVYPLALSTGQIAQNYADGNAGVGSPSKISAHQHALNNVLHLDVFEIDGSGAVGGEANIGTATVSAAAATTLNITTPITQQTRWITMTYTCSNATSTPRDLYVSFDAANTVGFSAARLRSASSGIIDIASSVIRDATCDGSQQTFSWDSFYDGVDQSFATGGDNSVIVKIQTQTTSVYSAQTSAFTVDNPSTYSVTNSIGSADTSQDGNSIACSSPSTPISLTIDGVHNFQDLIIGPNCTLYHTATNTATLNRIKLTLTGDFIVYSTGSVNLNYLGYPGGYTADPSTGAPTTTNAAPNHGGLSTIGAGSTYDSMSFPEYPGAGSQGGTSYNGGGAIYVDAHNIQVDGTITANGNSGGCGFDACGAAGGTIFLRATGTFSGIGVLSVTGGNGCCGSGGGGRSGAGGRIAIHYNASVPGNSVSSLTMRAWGNAASNGYSGAGTIYINDTSDTVGDKVVIDNHSQPTNAGLYTPIDPGTYAVVQILYGGLASVNGTLNATTTTVDSSSGLQALTINGTTISLSNSSTLYTFASTTSATNKLTLNGFTNVSVDATSSINVDNTGYLAGYTGDALSGLPTLTGGASSFQSGSHGGAGSNTGVGTYDSLTMPSLPGAGSGNSGTLGGSAVRIITQNLTLNGTITANGGSGFASFNVYGGAGGSVWITATGTVSGTGTIRANGGSGCCGSGGGAAGGGGRVAIYYDGSISGNATAINAMTIQAFGTDGYGGAISNNGTVYLRDTSQSAGDVILDNNEKVATVSRTTIEDGTYRTITVRNKGQGANNSNSTLNVTTLTIDDSSQFTGGTINASNITLTNSSLLTQDPSTSVLTRKLILNVSGSVSVDATSSITLDGKGFPITYTADQSTGNPTTVGGAVSFQSGSHGGLGSNTSAVAYDSVTQPLYPGAAGAIAGSEGGGYLKITTVDFTNNGTISANGNTGFASFNNVGGAGGGIWITTTGTVMGGGTIRANGGNGAGGSGGGAAGGGGRIAFYYDCSVAGNTAVVSAIPFQAYGNTGYGNNSSAGTIYIKSACQTDGDLVVDNNNLAPANNTKYFVTGQPTAATVYNITARNYGILELATPGTSFTVNGIVTQTNNGQVINNLGGGFVLAGINILTTTLPGGQVGVAYSQTVQSAGGYGPHTFVCRNAGSTVACSTVLPSGLDMNSAGVVSGTPTVTGTFPFTVRATEAAPGSGFAEKVITLTVGTAPLAPINLFSHSSDAQSCCTTGITDDSPVFSAVFLDADLGNTAEKYRIQVAADSGFSTVLWDSGSAGTSMASCAISSRCQNITYGGSALSLGGTTYYWRIKFWDNTDIEGSYSATATFSTSTAPTAPTNLFSNDSSAQLGLTNPVGITSERPIFSAIFHDPDFGDVASKYRIQVDDDNDFSSPVWDSGAAGTTMTSCNEGLRCANITYGAVLPLNLDQKLYYWRIKFFDQAGIESPWSEDPIATNKFTMGLRSSSIQNLQQNTAPTAPKIASVDVINSTALRYRWLDLSTNETGFRVLDAQGKVIGEVGAGVTSFDETGLSPNTLISGRTVVAYNAVGTSARSEVFPATATAMPDLLPALISRSPSSITLTANPTAPNADLLQSGFAFELIITPSDPSKAKITRTSDWQKSLPYTFTGISAMDTVQVRVVGRNQQGLANTPSAYLNLEQLAYRFNVSLSAVSKGTNALPRPFKLEDTLAVTISVKNTGTQPATNVFANLMLPSGITYVTRSAALDGRSVTDFADDDPYQGEKQTVSLIWPRMQPSEQHTLTLDLVLDPAGLANVRDQRPAASANPQLLLQTIVSISESDQLFSSPVLTIEPDMDALPPGPIVPPPFVPIVLPPAPLPTPVDIVTIDHYSDGLLQTEVGGPVNVPKTINQPLTTVSTDGSTFNIDVKGNADQLLVNGSAVPNRNIIEFTGMTSKPNSVITLIFNDNITVIVNSNDLGEWRTYVSAEQLGIQPGQHATVKIEAIAAKGDLFSDRVQVGLVVVGVDTLGDVTTQFDTSVSSSSFTTAVNEIRREIKRTIVKQEPLIQTTLASTAPVIIVSSVPLWGYLPYVPTLLYHALTYLVGLLGRKRRKQQRFYGIVYDSITKEALPLAIIRIYQRETNRLVATQVTDKSGRYEVLLEPAVYRLEVTKPTYVFPSHIVSADVDGRYQHVYHPDQGMAIQSESITIPDVPLDPANAQRQWQIAGSFQKAWMLLQRVGNYLAVPLLFVGALASTAVLISVPTNPSNWLLTILYILLLAAQLRLRAHVLKAWGVVYDMVSNAILPLTTVQLIDPSYGKVVMSRLTDYQGRYSFLPEPGTYVVKATKPGFSQVQQVVEAPKDHQLVPEKIMIDKPNQAITGDVPMRPAN